MFSSSSCTLRTYESLEDHVLLSDPSSTGVFGPSALADASSSTLDLLSVDLMHDLLEGVNEYDLGLILYNFIGVKHYFTAKDLNDRIACFDYGNESRNKPIAIKIIKIMEKHIKMSAAEALCFLRNIGLLIGELVPEGDPHWQIIILLIDIIDIVTSHVVYIGIFDRLESLVKEYLWRLNDLFPGCLKPKHLFLYYVLRPFAPATTYRKYSE